MIRKTKKRFVSIGIIAVVVCSLFWIAQSTGNESFELLMLDVKQLKAAEAELDQAVLLSRGRATANDELLKLTKIKVQEVTNSIRQQIQTLKPCMSDYLSPNPEGR